MEAAITAPEVSLDGSSAEDRRCRILVPNVSFGARSADRGVDFPVVTVGRGADAADARAVAVEVEAEER